MKGCRALSFNTALLSLFAFFLTCLGLRRELPMYGTTALFSSGHDMSRNQFSWKIDVRRARKQG